MNRPTPMVRWTSALLVALAWLMLVLTLDAHAESPPATIRFGISNAGVGTPPRVATGWLAVAQARHTIENEFEADGTKIEWTFFRGQGPAVNEALSNHQLDVTTLGDLPSVIGRAVGLPAKLVMVSNRGTNTYIVVQPDSPIRTVADLRGKRVGYHKGTATQLAAARIFARFGLSEKDVKSVNMEPASSLAAFQSGDLDALVGSVSLLPWRDKGRARVIYDSRADPSVTGSGHILVADAFSQAYPQTTQRIVTALVKVAQEASLEKNRDEVLALWASAGSTSAANYLEDLGGMPLAYKLSPRFDEFMRASNQKAVDEAYRYKLIRQPFDVASWIDARYVDAAIRTLKLEAFWPTFDAQGHVVRQP